MHERHVLMGLASLAGAASAVGGGWLMLSLCGLLLVCAAHGPTRTMVLSSCVRVWMRTPWRAALILVGAMMIWQLVGIELAMLMAGDVLAYVEILVAVNLMAARSRWRPMTQALVARFETIGAKVRRRLKPGAPRANRPPRRPPPASDADDRPMAWAFA